MLPHKRQSDHHLQTKVGTWGFCGNSRTLRGNWETLVKPEIKDSTLRRQVHADLPNGELTALHTAPLPKEAGGAMPTHAPGSRPTDHGPAYRSWHNPVTQLQPCSGYGGSPAGPEAQWKDAEEPGRSHTCDDLWKHTSCYRPSSGPGGSPRHSFSPAWLQSKKQFCPLGIWQEPQLTATLVTGLSNGERLHCGSSTVSQLQSHHDPGGTHQSRSPAGQGLYLPETASRDRSRWLFLQIQGHPHKFTQISKNQVNMRPPKETVNKASVTSPKKWRSTNHLTKTTN